MATPLSYRSPRLLAADDVGEGGTVIDYDTSQYPAGVGGWQALLQAIECASSTDESDWIEFKANLDLTKRTDRPALAKAIVAFANRDVARAARHLGGRALVIIGLEPGNLVGAPVMDPADLHNAIQPYLASPAPAWDIQYVTYNGQPVLAITVEAPQPGDPIHCIAKEGEKVRDGEVYVRSLGQSAPATSAELRALSTRLLAQTMPGLEVDVSARAGAGVPLFAYPPDWVDRWVDAERGRLMAPLAPIPPEQPADHSLRLGGLGTFGQSNALPGWASAAAHLADSASILNRLAARREEDRTEDEYAAEVEKYLDRCRQQLPRAIGALRSALSPVVEFQVRNLTDANYQRLEVHVHVQGDVTAFDGRAEFRGLSTYTPKPPRIWGPWTEAPLAGMRTPANKLLPSQTATFPTTNSRGPTIVNGGSADITFHPLDLRPRANETLDDGILLLAGSNLAGNVNCTWTATATNMDGRAGGTFTIPLRERRVDLSRYLDHGTNLAPG